MANDPTLVFLDANVLARPVTCTLLLVGADRAGSRSRGARTSRQKPIVTRASFLVTADVDDFAEDDLTALRLTAVHPDLFMSLHFSRRPAGGPLRRLQP